MSAKVSQWSINEMPKCVSYNVYLQYLTDYPFHQANINMAIESTQIARAAHQDSRALRIIQILSMLFLPASLVSSIFGMGFFSTSQGTDGQAIFTISHNWWLYLAISAPLTVLCMIFMGFYNAIQRPRTRRALDIERVSECELKEE